MTTKELTIRETPTIGINYRDVDRNKNEDENVDTFPLWFNTAII